MGIDLGTSSVKIMIFDVSGNKKYSCSKPYEIISSKNGYAEQNPNVWWQSTKECIRKSLFESNINACSIAAIGLSGQMHGLVCLNKNLNTINNAIIHCDTRSTEECKYIKEKLHEKKIDVLLNPIFTGFQLPSLLWLKRNKKEEYEKITKIVSPKDYIRFMLTNNLGTEITDASATLLFDIKKKNWSKSILELFHIDQNILQPINKPYDIAGKITKHISEITGLKEGTPVAFGLADQTAQALGNGLVKDNIATCTIGTSGQVFVPTSIAIKNPDLNTHTFCHAINNTWYSLGAILSAGLSINWLKQNILELSSYVEMDALVDKCALDINNPIFLPYLCGERTPHMSTKARGTFFGLSTRHNKGHIIRATMEGVVFALRDALSVIENLGVDVNEIIASGGGSLSPLWLQMQADIFGREIKTSSSDDQANLGAAITAATAVGLYSNLEEACNAMVKKNSTITLPNKKNSQIYAQRYDTYKKLYVQLKDLY